MANTHLGVPTSQLILLESITVKDSPDPRESIVFFRTKYENGLEDPAGGTFGHTAPTGKALIITEADWQYESGNAAENVTLRIFLSWQSATETIDRRAFESTILLGNNGGGGISAAVTTGIVVPHGVRITIDAIGSGAIGKIQHVLLRGYLIDFGHTKQ